MAVNDASVQGAGKIVAGKNDLQRDDTFAMQRCVMRVICATRVARDVARDRAPYLRHSREHVDRARVNKPYLIDPILPAGGCSAHDGRAPEAGEAAQELSH